MARYLGTVWDPSPNFTRGPTRKVRVVLHRMAGAYAGGLAWLKNPASQVSADFVVDNVSGEGRQLVDTADIAWAQAAYNPDSISIEIGGQTGDPVSNAAWRTVAAIVAQAAQVDGVPLELAEAADDPGLSYHGLLGTAGGNHPDCPGSIVVEARPAILAAALAATGGPTPPEVDRMQVTLGPDGTLYVAAAHAGDGHLLVFSRPPGKPWQVDDVTAELHNANPGASESFTVQP